MKEFLLALIAFILLDIAFQMAMISYHATGEEYSIFFNPSEFEEVEE